MVRWSTGGQTRQNNWPQNRLCRNFTNLEFNQTQSNTTQVGSITHIGHSQKTEDRTNTKIIHVLGWATSALPSVSLGRICAKNTVFSFLANRPGLTTSIGSRGPKSYPNISASFVKQTCETYNILKHFETLGVSPLAFVSARLSTQSFRTDVAAWTDAQNIWSIHGLQT